MYADMSDSNNKAIIRAQIDANLKRIYDETLQEAIPDRFSQLLAKLQQKSSAPPDLSEPDGTEKGQS